MSDQPKKYRRWGLSNSPHNRYLKANYIAKTNGQIATDLGRTEDGVRKQLNKLGLKRPLKADQEKIPKKRGRKKWFTILDAIHQRRRIAQLNAAVVERQRRNRPGRERPSMVRKNDVIASILDNQLENPTVPSHITSPDLSDKIALQLDSRTTVYIRPTDDPEKIRAKYLNRK